MLKRFYKILVFYGLQIYKEPIYSHPNRKIFYAFLECLRDIIVEYQMESCLSSVWVQRIEIHNQANVALVSFGTM